MTVADYLGYEVDDITVFGDSVNDIGMFGLCGKSIAVSNALDELKIHASELLPHSNDEDGVAKYLTRFCSNYLFLFLSKIFTIYPYCNFA